MSPADVELAEEWEFIADTEDLFGVGASRWMHATEWAWQVFVNAMEFVRQDPLESHMRTAIARELGAVRGVVAVAEEDREVWVVNGAPSGDALVRAVARAIEPFIEEVRAIVQE